VFGPLLVLVVSGFLIATIPDTWFASNTAAAIDHWARLFWPKLDHDATVLDARAPLRGAKYVTFVLYCASIIVANLLVVFPITWRAINKSSKRLTYLQSSALWRVSIGMLLLGFFAVLDTEVIGSDTSMGRVIANSSFLWFWTALLWGALSMTLGAIAILVAKLWKHGRPESNEDYHRRRTRDLR